jgi:hypothetical protein
MVVFARSAYFHVDGADRSGFCSNSMLSVFNRIPAHLYYLDRIYAVDYGVAASFFSMEVELAIPLPSLL